jgi:penicillin-insensitive murein endopeptidase
MRFGRSVGSPTEGRLIGGRRIEESNNVRIVPAYAGGDVRWGLEPLVAMIERAAVQVRRTFPGAITSVGHLSRPGGGEIDRHRSHESGRDADIGFFVRSAPGKQLFATHFVQFRGDGTALDWPGAYFDDAKNWTLVAALVSDTEAHVTHLFVAAPLRARLLAYAERIGVPASVRMRAAEVLQQPRGSLPHDDHFHVRIACPSGMIGCVENPAMRVTSRPSGPTFARGRRGAQSRDIVTSAPTRTPANRPGRSVEPPIAEPNGKSDDAPAVSIPVPIRTPIDDVDG